MCWRSSNRPIGQIAEDDIPAFKIMDLKKDGSLISFYFHYIYEIGKLYSDELILDSNDYSGEFYIAVAFHSYSTKCKACKSPISNYFFVLSAKGLIIDQDHSDYTLVKANCIIPKGSIYYLNMYGEYASNQIKIINIEEL